MSGLLKKTVKTAYIGLKTSLVYKYDFILSFLSGIMTLIVQLVFWPVFYQAGTDLSFAEIKDTVIAGYSLSEIMTYSLVVYFIQKGTSIMNISSIIKQDIMSGGINISLIRPIRYLWCKWLLSISGQIMSIVLSMISFILIIIIVNIRFLLPNNLEQIMFLSLFILISYIISFLINCMVGLISFWLLETSSVNMILNAVIAILSGAVFPINYIENNFFSAVRYLPFSYLAWYPAQIYLGKVNNNQIMQNIFICIIWIMILTFAVYIMWRKGVQRYAAFGG